jgi:hypothetical protein
MFTYWLATAFDLDPDPPRNQRGAQVLDCRVADPHSFDPDPDPAFSAKYRFGFDDQKLKKDYR